MKKIAIGESFKNIYNDNSIYIDKTKEIYNLIDYKRAFFSRPRRFGKSTVLDTIATLFEKGVDPYFKDTWIYDKWNDDKYPVLRLNFLKYSIDDYKLFSSELCSDIESFANLIGLNNFKSSNIPSISMKSLLNEARLQERFIVILIDEYDCQLTANINYPDLYNLFQKAIRNLYATLKGEEAIRFLGITGVTRLKDVSIFSVGSDLNDVTYQHDVSTITGFTRAEIKKYYADYLDLTASIENNIPVAQVIEEQREFVLDRLAYEYNGYCFDELNQNKVFSTWSVNKFFTWVQKNNLVKYGEYWYENGGIPSILSNYLKTHDFAIQNFEEELEVDFNDFTNPTSLLTMNQTVLMCQTGYLTLNSELEPGSDLRVKIPNYEVRKALYRLLSNKTFGISSKISSQNKDLLEKGTSEDIYNLLNMFVNSISYEKYPITNESLLRGFLQSFLIGAGLLVSVEIHNSKGRSDIQIDFKKRRIVIELKYANLLKDVDKKLEEAVSQIKDRNYGNNLPFKEDLVRLALVFCGEKREFVSFKSV